MSGSRNVFVDVDDTISDTQTAMLAYVNERASRRYSYEEMTEAYREGDHPEYEGFVRQFLNSPQLVLQNKPYADALAAMQRLHQAGYVIHIVSSRREPLHQVTLQWLERHGFADFIEEIHPRRASQKSNEFKRTTAERLRPLAAFDDTLSVVRELAAVCPVVYLIDKPWNAADDLPRNVVRADGFGQAVGLFLQR